MGSIGRCVVDADEASEQNIFFALRRLLKSSSRLHVAMWGLTGKISSFTQQSQILSHIFEGISPNFPTLSYTMPTSPVPSVSLLLHSLSFFLSQPPATGRID